MKKLSIQDRQTAASNFGLEAKSVNAVISVECAGDGFNADGSVKIQFEPVYFHRFLVQNKIDHEFTVLHKIVNGKSVIDKYKIETADHVITNGVEGQTNEYIAYTTAKLIHTESAMLATSIGLGQVMGFNYVAAGYKSVSDMIESFKESEYNQLIGMLNFIKSHEAIYQALKNKDWTRFAELYNGPAQNGYDRKLETAYGH